MFWQANNYSNDPNKSLINIIAMVYASDTILENSDTVSWNKPELDGSVTYKVIVSAM